MAQNRVTMRDIAKACGVSVATVSHALNHSKRENISDSLRLKIIQAATEMRYNPAAIRDKGGFQAAGIIINLKENNTPSKKLLYYDLAAELAVHLRECGFSAQTIPSKNLAGVLQNKELQKLDAWFMIDIDNQAFASGCEGFYSPVILLDSDVEDSLYCKIIPKYADLFETAHAMLRQRPAFILLEDMYSTQLLAHIIAPFAPSDVFINRPGANLASFLEKRPGKKGIVVGDLLAMQAAALFHPKDLLVVSWLGRSGLTPADAPHLYARNKNKAAIAVETMRSMLSYEFESTQDNYIFIDFESE